MQCKEIKNLSSALQHIHNTDMYYFISSKWQAEDMKIQQRSPGLGLR